MRVYQRYVADFSKDILGEDFKIDVSDTRSQKNWGLVRQFLTLFIYCY